MTDFPFYREIEEFKAGLRPPVERFVMVVVFSLCAMMVGTIVGVQQGQTSPRFMDAETSKSVPASEKVLALKAAVESGFKGAKSLPDFRLVESGSDLEIHFNTSRIFGAGQASLSGEDGDRLHKLALALLPAAKDYKVKFEAYTDDAPISGSTGKYPSNWELSGARAARVLRIFNVAGFPVENLTFVGWGETHPLVPNRSPSGETIQENRLKNRRMVVRVLTEK
jgi:chemotaxis protein MotB